MSLFRAVLCLYYYGAEQVSCEMPFISGFTNVLTAGKSRQIPVVLKSKPTDIEVCNMVNKMAQACGLSLAIQYEKFKMNTDFRYHLNTILA